MGAACAQLVTYMSSNGLTVESVGVAYIVVRYGDDKLSWHVMSCTPRFVECEPIIRDFKSFV